MSNVVLMPVVDDQPIPPLVTLTDAITDLDWFGRTFASPTYWTWKTVARVVDGIPLTEPREIELFETATGLSYKRHNRRAVRTLLLLCGRRGGKDRFLSAVGVWRAALCLHWKRHISAGEQAVVILLGADRKQAGILRRYCHGLLEAPKLRAEVVRDTGEVIEFRNGGSLEIITNDQRLVRGRSAIAVLGSECCHWKTGEAALSSDEEVVGAAVPSMAMCPDHAGLLLLGSSVHVKRGYMYRKYRELFGNEGAKDEDGIVWFAPSTVMNPKLPPSVIERALAEDKAKASAEYLNVWRDSESAYIPVEVLEACTDFGVTERPPVPGVVYHAHTDASTGFGPSAFTLAIAHRDTDNKTVILDLLIEVKPPFVVRDVVKRFAEVVKRYNIRTVVADQFARGFHDQFWKDEQITLVDSERDTSQMYMKLLPMLAAREVRLIDNKTLRSQFAALERHLPPSGHEVIRKPQTAGARDDCATAAAGALVAAGDHTAYLRDWNLWV